MGFGGASTRKNICRCLACGEKFEFKDAAQKPTFSTFRPACPKCKSERLETISLENSSDNSYIRGLVSRKFGAW